LWHGTGSGKVDPKDIALGEDGLNVLYSNDGMWGVGIYTA
jgi:hypothetical protein